MALRRIWILFLLATPCFAATAPFRVVIDPGHGGSDLGTVYENGRRRITEKEITLDLAKKVADELRKKGFSAILTRQIDRDVPLAQRTHLANRLKADVFLSIHMNSSAAQTQDSKESPEGVETFILNNATDASSRRLAQLENAILSPQDPVNPSSPEQLDVALILKDLRLDANLSESKRLACQIQEKLVQATQTLQPGSKKKLRNRGVKQALFHVLLGADMPSVLVEAGFLSSPQDRAVVLSSKGQMTLATAIARAVEQYKHSKGKLRAQALSRLNSCKVN